MKKKVKKSNKKILICIVICLVFNFVFWSSVFKISFGPVKSYITEQVDVYIPDGVADEFKQYLSIDIDEYWVFHLNEKEQKEMKKDIETNSWRVMDVEDLMMVERYTGSNDSKIYESIKNHKCYIYIFDCDNKTELPNDYGYFGGNDCYHWLFFIYDTDSDYYYVVHKSM